MEGLGGDSNKRIKNHMHIVRYEDYDVRVEPQKA
jgi:hypothetical protein